MKTLKPAERKLLDKTLKSLLVEFDKLTRPRTVKVQPKGLPVIIVTDLVWEEDVYCYPDIPSCTFKGIKNDRLVKSGLFSIQQAKDFYENMVRDYDFIDILADKDKTLKAAIGQYDADIKAFCKKAEQFGELYFEDSDWFFSEYARDMYPGFDLKGNLKYAKDVVDDALEAM
jgi:hypothetical protein